MGSDRQARENVAWDERIDGAGVYQEINWFANRWIGGIPMSYYDSLQQDPRKPLYNKALQGTYPPGSTWKLATTVTMRTILPCFCSSGVA